MAMDWKFLVVLFLLIGILALSGFGVFVERTSYVTLTETRHVFLTETVTVTSIVTRELSTVLTRTVTTTVVRTGRLEECVVFGAVKDVFERSEPVVFRLVNNCGFNVVLPNSAPWLVVDAGGNVVFSPVALQVITTVKPGEVREWTWDQRSSEGEVVPAGTYAVRLMTINVGYLSDTFEIE
jgi:integral membrane sensor domain MASE1